MNSFKQTYDSTERKYIKNIQSDRVVFIIGDLEIETKIKETTRKYVFVSVIDTIHILYNYNTNKDL